MADPRGIPCTRPGRDRRPALDRRLRHRLLVARVPERLPVDGSRSTARSWAAWPGSRRRSCARRSSWRRAWARCRGRGRRDAAIPFELLREPRLRPGAGLPLCPAAPRRGARGFARRHRSRGRLTPASAGRSAGRAGSPGEPAPLPPPPARPGSPCAGGTPPLLSSPAVWVSFASDGGRPGGLRGPRVLGCHPAHHGENLCGSTPTPAATEALERRKRGSEGCASVAGVCGVMWASVLRGLAREMPEASESCAVPCEYPLRVMAQVCAPCLPWKDGISRNHVMAIAVTANASPARTVESGAGAALRGALGADLRVLPPVPRVALGRRGRGADDVPPRPPRARARSRARARVPVAPLDRDERLPAVSCGRSRAAGHSRATSISTRCPLPANREVELRELRGDLRHALDTLPDTQRRALVLREWQGLESHEIASELGMTTTAAYALLTRARRSLARALSAAGTRPVLGVDFVSVLAKLKALLAGGAAKVAVTTVAVGTLAVGGVAVERAVVHRNVPPRPGTPTAALEAGVDGTAATARAVGATAMRPSTVEQRTDTPSATDAEPAAGATTIGASDGPAAVWPAAPTPAPAGGDAGPTGNGGERVRPVPAVGIAAPQGALGRAAAARRPPGRRPRRQRRRPAARGPARCRPAGRGRAAARRRRASAERRRGRARESRARREAAGSEAPASVAPRHSGANCVELERMFGGPAKGGTFRPFWSPTLGGGNSCHSPS